MKPIVAMITGHRPEKVGGYGKSQLQVKIRDWMFTRLFDLIRISVINDVPLTIISGMALGIDQWWAETAIDLSLPVHAYIPFVGQERMWPAESQRNYSMLLQKCEKRVICSEGGYNAWKMQRRDERMVDDATHHYAVWNGSRSGTGNTIEYMRKNGIEPVFFTGADGFTGS